MNRIGFHQPMVLTAQRVVCDSKMTKYNLLFDQPSDDDDKYSEDHSKSYQVFKKLNRMGKPWRYKHYAEVKEKHQESRTQNMESVAVQTEESIENDLGFEADNSSVSSYGSGNLKTNDSKAVKRKRAASRMSSDSEKSNSGKACQIANKSFFDFNSIMDSVQIVSSDKLFMDVLIVCNDLETCRFLSASFGIVSLDDILVQFENGKLSTDKIYYTDSCALSTIRLCWNCLISNSGDGFRRTFRYFQTQFATSLSCGAHNIGITCCEALVPFTVCNMSSIILLDREKPEKEYNFLISVEKSTGNKLVDCCAALTTIVNISLGFKMSYPSVIKMKGQYFRIDLSLISVLPFFVLRTLCENEMKNYIESLRNINGLYELKYPIVNL